MNPCVTDEFARKAETMVALGIFFRWLHVITARLAVGGIFFMVVVLPVGLHSLDGVVRDEVGLRFRRVFKIVIHACILLFLISGIYNAIANWPAYKAGVPMTHALLGVHVLLALIVFAIALVMLAGRSPRRGARGWMGFNLVLLFLVVAAASSLKWARETGLAARQRGLAGQTQPALPSHAQGE
jgi:uncharacterized membrane protein